MTAADRRRDGVCGPCQIGECGHCDGSIDLKVGAGPAVPLTRCAHACHRGRVQARYT